MLRRLERDEQRSSVKMSEALNCDNRLEVCKMQHTTSHQVRSLKKSILHHLLGSFERVEQRSSVKKLSKLWVLRSFSKFAKCSTPLSSIKIIQKVHLTPPDKFRKGWAALIGQKGLKALNSENQHTSSHQASSFRNCILHHLLEVCKQQHTTSHQARSFKKFISHHLLRSFERDEQHSSVQKFPMLWILRTFLDHCKMQYKPVIKQDLVEV